MDKERTTPEAAAASFGVGRLTRHLFVCAGPDGVDPAVGDATPEHAALIIQEHLIGGRIVRPLCVAEHALDGSRVVSRSGQ